MIFIKLFFEYFKIGLFSIGGGLATLPFIYELQVKYPDWLSTADITNMIAVSESTPGPMGVNMATYVGNMVGGLPGGIVATLGLVSPSIIVIAIVAHFLRKFKDSPIVEAVMSGLRPASLALVCVATVSVARAAILRTELYEQTGVLLDLFDIRHIILAIILFVAMRKIDIHPIWYIVIAAVVGIVFKF
ncbi:MAG: chromate transporter [Lachnospiraceae bacterium]|nr:chromate transporter [Lachnospiraceae bacterium]